MIRFFFSALAIFSFQTCFAGDPERMVVVQTDDSPGNSYIDVVQDDSGVIQSLVYETDHILNFAISDMHAQPSVLKQKSGKNIILLQLDPSFDPTTGGFVTVQFLNNGITGNYKDFRILIAVANGLVVFHSDPDPTDPKSDANQYTDVFNKLFMHKRSILGTEVGIGSVVPSIVSVSDVVDGPAPLPLPSPSPSPSSVGSNDND